jgi:hypothetical protein
MKMHLIQFDSDMTAFQMELMEVICIMENMMSQEVQHCMESPLE